MTAAVLAAAKELFRKTNAECAGSSFESARIAGYVRFSTGGIGRKDKQDAHF